MKHSCLLDENKVIPCNYGLSMEKPLYSRFYTYNDKESVGFDMHYDLEIGIVRSGKMLRKYLTYEAELGPGQVWLGGIWEPHGYYLHKVPCEVAILIISPEFIISKRHMSFNKLALFSMPPERRPQVSEKNRLEILKICTKLELITKSESRIHILWKDNLLTQILLFLIEDAPELLQTNRPIEQISYSGIQPAIQIVFNNKKFIGVEDAAMACALSPSHFSKTFKELMGIPFSQFALRYRIKETARQLLATNDSIKSIASDWGFFDISHFYHCFKRHFSLTPGEYRKLHNVE